MKKRIKVNGVIIASAVAVTLLFPDVFLRGGRPGVAEEFFKITGFCLILLGQLLRVSARGYKAQESQNSRLLVRKGPYAAVRNPMYLGILLIGSGALLVLFQWWVAALFLAVFFIRYILLIIEEEKKLLAFFPREYRDYTFRVPRLFPSLSILEGEASDYLPFKLGWLKKEMASIAGVIVVILGIGFWQRAKAGCLSNYRAELAAALLIILLFFCFSIYLDKKTDGSKAEVTV